MSTTLAGLLQARLQRDPGRPFVTFYDDATGERTELSVTTWANWVAKTAGVLSDDLDLAEGDRLRIDLPAHWLGGVFAAAAWLVGIEVVSAGQAEASVGRDGADLVCSLHPFALPCATPVATLDFGHLWPNQPDVFLGVPAGPQAPAYDGRPLGDLIGDPVDDRVLSTTPSTTPEGVALLLGLLGGAGSMVLVANPDPSALDSRVATEHVDRVG